MAFSSETSQATENHSQHATNRDDSNVNDVASGLDRLTFSSEPTYAPEPPPPPPPPISTPGIVTMDVTDEFLQASKALAPGQVVKDHFFTLFEAVGALEVMDPKMDSGYLAEGETLELDYDLSRELLPSELIGIIDQLLCMEMAWHLGHPLRETLFTCVYIDAILEPEPLTFEQAHFLRDENAKKKSTLMHQVLRAYCLAMIKTCWWVAEQVKHENYYEEEDFHTNTYHRAVLGSFRIEDFYALIQEARTAVENESTSLDADMALAIQSRLSLRYSLLQAVDLSSPFVEPDAAQQPWLALKAIFQDISKTHHIALAVPDAFTMKLQRRLASTMPPRPMVELSFDDAYKSWVRLCEDGSELQSLIRAPNLQSILTFVVAWMTKQPQPLVWMRTLVQSYIFQDNIVLGRMSIRQLIDTELATVVLPSSLLLDPLNDEVEAVNHPRFVIAQQMESFRRSATPPVLSLIRALCQNRCRLRRNLMHVVQEWEMFQIGAEELDQLLQTHTNEEPVSYEGPYLTSASIAPSGVGHTSAYAMPLSSWVYLYKFRMMEWTVQLGFELDIYQPGELAGMYWYLNYLAKQRAQHVERIKAFVTKSYDDQRHSVSSNSVESPAPWTDDREASFARSLQYLRITALDAVVTWELADALSCLYTALQRLGHVPAPVHPYSNDELRFEIRVRPFAVAGLPELPPFSMFRQAAEQPENGPTAVLRYAERAAVGAKRGLEALTRLDARESHAGGEATAHAHWLGRTQAALKSCIAAGIAIQIVLKAIAGLPPGASAEEERKVGEGLVVELPRPEKGYHAWWLVPKVMAKR